MSSVSTANLSGLLGGASGSGSTANLFTALAASYSSGSAGSGAPATPQPTPPWSASVSSGNAAKAAQSALVQQALAGQPIINLGSAKLNVSTKNAAANNDYKSLFALYQGLNTLYHLTTQAQAPGASPSELNQLQQALTSGLSQVSSFLQAKNFDSLTVVQGGLSTSETSAAGVATASTTYVGQTIVLGSSADASPAFAGPVQFSATVTDDLGASKTVHFNLADLGSQTRSLTNVVKYINDQLTAAGVKTTISTQRTPGATQTEKVGGKTVKLGTSPDQYALVVNSVPGENLAFSAPATADAVYVAQGSGPNNASGQQLLKFQSTTTQGGTPPAALAQPQDTNVTSGEAWQNNLPSTVTGVQATAAGPNGSVYVLANINGSTGGQTLTSSSGVALLKYDSAGNIQFAQTLGASVNASGLGLAVSSAGEVAVTGQVTGSLKPGDGRASTAQSAFVNVYDASGDEQWSQSIPAADGAKGNAVAFAADGSVYVAGQTNSPILGASGSISTSGGFLAGFSATGAQTFVTQYGSTGANSATGVTVNGNHVLVAGVENGAAVVRSYQANGSGAGTLTASRNLGYLDGGSVAGIAVNNGQVVVAGTTQNTALAAGTTTSTGASGSNAFVAALDPSLTANTSDSVAYYQNQGSTTVTAVSVSDGNVYIAGQTGPQIKTTVGSGTSIKTVTGKAGYVAQINPDSGQVGFTTALQGQNGIASPTSIAVANGAASVLDRLGLPQGEIRQSAASKLLTTATSLQAGDSFSVLTTPGEAPTKITIQAADTLQTLANRINQASNFKLQAKVDTTATEQKLQITASNPQDSVQLLAGPTGQDALSALGLTAGLVQPKSPSTSSSSTPPPQTAFGLNLSPSLNLTTTTGAKQAGAQIQFAISELQSAYQAIVKANTPKSAQAAASSGKVPAAVQAQLANYRAGLARLTGSG